MKRRLLSLGADRLAAMALLACAVLAVANLPRDELAVGWMLAWTLPAALFGALRQHRRRPWLHAVTAAVAQIAAFTAALHFVGPLSRPAILASTILPPLAFVTVRRRDADAALGLFLSFCVLLVGVILGGPDVPLLAAYGASACLSLRSEAHLAVLASTGRGRRQRSEARVAQPVLLSALAVALPCLLAAFVIDRTLAWLPSPLQAGSGDAAATANAPNQLRRAGLDDSFDLGGGGMLADLAGEQLVLVRTGDGRPMPTDLYLRSGFFAAPGRDAWSIGKLLLSHPRQRDHELAPRTSGLQLLWLEVERFAGARNFVFVPPTVTHLREVPDLEADYERMWLRQSHNGEQTDYAVAYQELPPPRHDARVDAGARTEELLKLPADFGDDDRRRYEQLLDSWDVRGTPMQIATRIAEGLADHCSYDRVEPVGPYRHALDNFLFAAGNRRGYCMYFASAAAMMLRLRGVPCRIGVGLYGGEVDRTEPVARIFGSQHAHAWVEIPIADRGYVVFDPTPPSERGRRMPTLTDDAGGAGTPDAGAGSASGLLGDVFEFLMQPWLLAIALLLAIAATMWRRPAAPPAQVVLPRSIKTARRLLVRILQVLAEAGHLRRRGQTIEQFSAVLASRDRLPPDLRAAFRAYQEVRFGGRHFDAVHESALLRGIEAARRTEPWEPARETDQGQ